MNQMSPRAGIDVRWDHTCSRVNAMFTIPMESLSLQISRNTNGCWLQRKANLLTKSCDDTPPILKLPKVREKMKEARHLDMVPQGSKVFADNLTVILKKSMSTKSY